MWSETELATIRRAYARQTMFAAGVTSQAIEDAYAAARREDFVGPGPWKVFRFTGYAETPSADPAYLYTDNLVGLIPQRMLNNGQPSGHAMWIAAVEPRAGEHVVHIGAGTGYYSAIFAHLVGAAGRVTAIEYEADLAAKAKANLAFLPQAVAVQGDGASFPFDAADVVYVNAGATRPMDHWLDRLKDGGRMLLPLTTNASFTTAPRGLQGAMFRIERRGADFLASVVSATAIIPGESMRDEASEAALATAFAKGGVENVSRLYRTDQLPDEQCWVRAPGWSLAYS
jgi:protein-L-isoaspartate(D-aspartate) O-methyltransferase